MYGKLFASMYHGTLRGKAHEILVLSNLVIFADREGFIDKTVKTISEEVGLTEEETRAAVDRLMLPDADSRSTEEDGARLVLIEDTRSWGWQVVNYEKYRDMKSEEDRRAQNREAQRRSRAKKKSAPVSTGQHESSASAQVEAEVEEKAEKERSAPKRAARTPLAEQKGLIGRLAKAWKGRHGSSPRWSASAVIAFNTFLKGVRGEAQDGDVVDMGCERRFARFLAQESDQREYHVDKQHSIGKFVQHWDRWTSASLEDPQAHVPRCPSGRHPPHLKMSCCDYDLNTKGSSI